MGTVATPGSSLMSNVAPYLNELTVSVLAMSETHFRTLRMSVANLVDAQQSPPSFISKYAPTSDLVGGQMVVLRAPWFHQG